ncbi:MAG: triose-phosphate isomerase, partial [Chloroflexota bacterium]|nr:triose-phosphate isomerase [Chloroflexota bacterium]
LGHSERRTIFHETDQDVRRKIEAALAHDLLPIICVGEDLAEYEAGQTLEKITRQVTAALENLATMRLTDIVIAYEPIWAIGTGKPATGEGANQVAGEIRGIVAKLHGQMIADEMRIQYGGSVNAANIAEFVSQPHIDGALVGGASLDPNAFVRIVAVTNELKHKAKGLSRVE